MPAHATRRGVDSWWQCCQTETYLDRRGFHPSWYHRCTARHFRCSSRAGSPGRPCTRCTADLASRGDICGKKTELKMCKQQQQRKPCRVNRSSQSQVFWRFGCSITSGRAPNEWQGETLKCQFLVKSAREQQTDLAAAVAIFFFCRLCFRFVFFGASGVSPVSTSAAHLDRGLLMRTTTGKLENAVSIDLSECSRCAANLAAVAVVCPSEECPGSRNNALKKKINSVAWEEFIQIFDLPPCAHTLSK